MEQHLLKKKFKHVVVVVVLRHVQGKQLNVLGQLFNLTILFLSRLRSPITIGSP